MKGAKRPGKTDVAVCTILYNIGQQNSPGEQESKRHEYLLEQPSYYFDRAWSSMFIFDVISLSTFFKSD